MTRWQVLIRYDLPLHFILIITEWLPDNTPFLELRGWLAHFFFQSCGVRLNLGRSLSFYNPSLVSLGNNIYIAHGCRFIADDEIILHDDVQVGPYTVIVSSNHVRYNNSFKNRKLDLKSIVIGAGCWIGSHVTITAGTTVGTGSLVAAGSVTRGNLPSNALIGGIPAKVIKFYANE